MQEQSNRLGETFITNEGYSTTIIRYKNSSSCDIIFCNGVIICNIQYDRVKKGGIKNPYHKSVYNVGYFGVGDHRGRDGGKQNKKYNYWFNMIKRCYSEKRLLKNDTYKDVIVCEEWHNFQNFAQWFEENYNPEIMEGWQLDKDILFKDNKIYSSETCCFVPQEINSLFIKKDKNRGNYPIGVYKNRLRYIAQVAVNKKQKFLGYFNTPEEAFQAYKTAKEAYIKELANKWKDKIDLKVYQALINYQVEITD